MPMGRRRPLAGLAALAVAAGLVPLTSDAASAVAVSASAAPVAYVADSGATSVDAIDTATNAVTASIKVGFNTTEIVITKDGATAYALSANCGACMVPAVGHFGIYPISTATNKPGKVIDPGATMIALDPDGQLLYALNGNSDTVTPIVVATNKAMKPIKVGGSPTSIAFTPQGKYAYITTSSPGTVVSVRTATGKVRAPIKIGGDPTDITLAPSGEIGFVIDSGQVIPILTAVNKSRKPVAAADQVLFSRGGEFALALTSHSVFPILIETGPGTPVKVGGIAEALAFGPSGRLAYVASADTGTVTPIHLRITPLTVTVTAGQPIKVGSSPDAVAFTAGGTAAYVTNVGDNTVTPIDVATGHPGTPIQVGQAPDAIAITP
jgi:YVTN family beta-propeller protein